MTHRNVRAQFEAAITQLTKPLNGQLPRPWMTDLTDPLTATLFIVGSNQAKTYPASRLSHVRHLNGLYNRLGESCRELYEELVGGRSSPTRRNTDLFRRILQSEGISQVLETNVVCYSTPMSGDLRLPQHRGGSVRGSEIFRVLLHFIRPGVLIAHGVGTRRNLGKLLGAAMPPVPVNDEQPRPFRIDGTSIFIIPSLAPPEWNKWHGWARQYLTRVAKGAAAELKIADAPTNHAI